ncbi:MAG: HPr family phosphocarrier protein [Candidatus Methylacidiphilales bacterium]|jgi:phosphocarrier protein HPr
MPANEGAKHGHEAVIQNRLGLHARPAAMFVREANRHKCEIHVEKDGETINGKSIMGLMMLAAGMGSRIRIVASGPGAEEAVLALRQLVERKFDEE